jgi:recombination protein RecT
MKQQDLELILQPRKEQFIEMLNDKQAFARELSFAAQAVNGSEQLQKCDAVSIAASVWNLALTGLTLNPIMKLAYLTPRWNSKTQRNECVLMPSYQGLAKLITDTGAAKKIEARLIMEGDEFIEEYGNEYRVMHKPKFPKGKTIIGAYAIATLANGEQQIEVMDKSELDYVRSKSDGWKAFEAGKTKSSIWQDWEGEMCRKTVVKRLVKYLPKNKAFETVARAVELDNADYPAQDWKRTKIESLLLSAAIDPDYKDIIEAKISDDELTEAEATNLLFELEQAQVEPVAAGFNAGQKEIARKVKQSVERENT